MLRQRFRLTAATIATTCDDGKTTAFQIPAGSLIVVLDNAGLDWTVPSRQVNVEWEGKTVRMFAVDIRERGQRVQAA